MAVYTAEISDTALLHVAEWDRGASFSSNFPQLWVSISITAGVLWPPWQPMSLHFIVVFRTTWWACPSMYCTWAYMYCSFKFLEESLHLPWVRSQSSHHLAYTDEGGTWLKQAVAPTPVLVGQNVASLEESKWGKARNRNRINKQGLVTPRSRCVCAFASLFALNDAIPGVPVSDDKMQTIDTRLNSDWIVSPTTKSVTRRTIRGSAGVLRRFGKPTVSERTLIRRRLNLILATRAG